MTSKSKAHTLSKEQAQALTLHCQGLLDFSFGKGKQGALNAIEHLGYVQIDTLSVVTRAHHHTLWTRVKEYQEKHLHELLEKDKSIFEYWSHAASYLPMSEYRFSLLRKKEYSTGRSHWFEQDKKVKKYVLDRIKAEGPLQSKDFEHKRTGPGNWYEWKPAKQALEQLFMEGKLMVAKRQGFQKVYDVTERVLPPTVDTTMPTEKEAAEHLILKTIQANGFAEEKIISYLRSHAKEPVKKALTLLLKNGIIQEIKVEDKKEVYYTTAEQLKQLNKIKTVSSIHLLSPFDNAVIQRKRVNTLFDFDYMIECYVPKAKRKYGYFCLPVLYNGRFVARFDPKADRASKTFYIKQIHYEKGFKPDANFKKAFKEKIKSFAEFNNCKVVVGG